MIAHAVGPDRIDIAYEIIGEGRPLLLVQGLGAQLVGWPDGFCAVLAGHGFQVVRFDNRDVGRSTHLHDAPPADLPAALGGDLSSVSYTLTDMAADAAGLLDVLGIAPAHVVGASMGAAIAQLLAVEHPERVRTLTSMMFTTGDPAVGRTDPEAAAKLFSGPPVSSRAEAVAQAVRAVAIVGSPGYPADPAEVAERAGRAYDRGFDPAGLARQAVATVASGDRTARLRGLTVPTLVVHGADDPMCAPDGGRATADVIPGAELLLVDGMGHNLPRELWPMLAARIAAHAEAG